MASKKELTTKNTHGGERPGAGAPKGTKHKGKLPRSQKTMRLRKDLLERAAQHPATLTDVVELGLELYLDQYEQEVREGKG